MPRAPRCPSQARGPRVHPALRPQGTGPWPPQDWGAQGGDNGPTAPPAQDGPSRGALPSGVALGPPCPPSPSEASEAAPPPQRQREPPHVPSADKGPSAALGASAKVERPRDNEGSEAGGPRPRSLCTAPATGTPPWIPALSGVKVPRNPARISLGRCGGLWVTGHRLPTAGARDSSSPPPKPHSPPTPWAQTPARAPHPRGEAAPGPAGTRSALPVSPRCPSRYGAVLTPSVPPPRTGMGEHRAVTPQGHRAGSRQRERDWPDPTSPPKTPRPTGTPRSAAGWGPRLGLPRAWAAAAAPSVVNWIFPEPLSGESEIPGGAGATRTLLREKGGERRPPCPPPPSPSSAPRSRLPPK